MKSLIVLFLVYYVATTLFKKLTKQAVGTGRKPAPPVQPFNTGQADPEPAETPVPDAPAAPGPGAEALFSLLGIEQPRPEPVFPQPSEPLPASPVEESVVIDEIIMGDDAPSRPEPSAPVTATGKKIRTPRLRITAATARQGIVLAEILGPCQAMREDAPGF